MKKQVPIILATTLCLILSACGASATPAPAADAAATPAPAADAAAPAAGGNSLTVWCWDPTFNIYAMNEAAKIYKETDPTFQLNVVETAWNDIQTKLTTAASANQLDTLPDITLIQDNAFQKNVINFTNVFTDLTGSGVPFDQFAPAKVAYSVVNGKNYGVPFDNGACVNALRTDVLQQAGYTVKDLTDITWDQFITIGEDVLKKTGKPLLSSTAGEPDLIMLILQSCGSSLFNPDGTPNILNNKELKEVLNVYTQLVKKGILLEVNNWDEYVGSFTNSTVAGTINGCWILGSIQSTKDQSGKWAITDLPALNVPNATHYSNNGGSSWAVTSNCKNPKLAADFFTKTFAGSSKFYDTILPSSGALATYLPAGKSDVYNQPQPFFNNQPVYADITAYAGKVPSNITGVYYYEARDAVGTAMTKIVAGTDPDSALKEAEDTVKFKLGS